MAIVIPIVLAAAPFAAGIVLGTAYGGYAGASAAWEAVSQMELRPVVVWNQTKDPILVRFYYGSTVMDAAVTANYRVVGSMALVPKGTPLEERVKRFIDRTGTPEEKATGSGPSSGYAVRSDSPIIPATYDAALCVAPESRIVLLAPPFRALNPRRLIITKCPGACSGDCAGASQQDVAQLFPHQLTLLSKRPRKYIEHKLPTLGNVGYFIKQADFDYEAKVGAPPPPPPTPQEKSAIGKDVVGGVSSFGEPGLLSLILRRGGMILPQAYPKHPPHSHYHQGFARTPSQPAWIARPQRLQPSRGQQQARPSRLEPTRPTNLVPRYAGAAFNALGARTRHIGLFRNPSVVNRTPVWRARVTSPMPPYVAFCAPPYMHRHHPPVPYHRRPAYPS